MPVLRLLLSLALLLSGVQAAAQDANGVFLIAKPELEDTNFSRTVVLVTQAEDSSTIGVILNRPSSLRLAELFGEEFDSEKYTDRIFQGGPVMQRTLIAVFHAETPPPAPAFHVLRNLYMSMHPDNIRQLLGSESRRYRLYLGFSGWAPSQLKGEFDREGWFVLPADEDLVFRKDSANLWDELVTRAQAMKTGYRK